MVRVRALRFQLSVLYSVENSPFRLMTVARVGTPCISMTAVSALLASDAVTLAAKPGRWNTTRVTYSSFTPLWAQAVLGMEMTQRPFTFCT